MSALFGGSTSQVNTYSPTDIKIADTMGISDSFQHNATTVHNLSDLGKIIINAPESAGATGFKLTGPVVALIVFAVGYLFLNRKA